MADKQLTDDEIRWNLKTLRHIPAWLQFREVTQRRLADLLGVSEPTVSKWLKGTQPMKMAQFSAIARLLDVQPEDLLFPPPGDGTAIRYKEIAEIVSDLTPEDLASYIAVGRAMKNRKGG